MTNILPSSLRGIYHGPPYTNRKIFGRKMQRGWMIKTLNNWSPQSASSFQNLLNHFFPKNFSQLIKGIKRHNRPCCRCSWYWPVRQALREGQDVRNPHLLPSCCSISLRRPITDLGGKARVMELMSHPNSDVRYRALLSVQQLVSQPWVTA